MENVLNFIISLFFTYCLISLFQIVLKKLTLFLKKQIIKYKKKKILGKVNEDELLSSINNIK
mgnify:CR=1 FL=1